MEDKENKILTSETTKEIYAALAKAQAEFSNVQEGGYNEYDGYKYAKLSNYIDSIRPALGKHDLGLNFTTLEKRALEPRTTSKGNKEYIVEVKMALRIFHSSGEWMEVYGYGEGQDRGDKAYYKAVTGCRKYIIASALNLATEDDPENDGDDNKGDDKKPPAPKNNLPAYNGYSNKNDAEPYVNDLKTTPRQPTKAKPVNEPAPTAKREYEVVPKGESKTIVEPKKQPKKYNIAIPYPADNLRNEDALNAYFAVLNDLKTKDTDKYFYIYASLYTHAKRVHKLNDDLLKKLHAEYTRLKEELKNAP